MEVSHKGQEIQERWVEVGHKEQERQERLKDVLDFFSHKEQEKQEKLGKEYSCIFCSLWPTHHSCSRNGFEDC